MTRRADPQHHIVDAALARLASQGTIFHYTHQNIAELWNAMTRPQERNGLGLSAADAEREVRAIESGMIFLPDGEAVYRSGQDRCAAGSRRCSGTRRAVGSGHVCSRRGHVLTLNVTDFTRFSGLTAIHPSSIR
jgi:hypothetical protein